MNDGDRDRRMWRWVAAGSFSTLFIALFLFAAAADAFLSRFMPLFLGLMLVALVLYSIAVGIVRLVQRVRRRDTPNAPPTPPADAP